MSNQKSENISTSQNSNQENSFTMKNGKKPEKNYTYQYENNNVSVKIGSDIVSVEMGDKGKTTELFNNSLGSLKVKEQRSFTGGSIELSHGKMGASITAQGQSIEGSYTTPKICMGGDSIRGKITGGVGFGYKFGLGIGKNPDGSKGAGISMNAGPLPFFGKLETGIITQKNDPDCKPPVPPKPKNPNAHIEQKVQSEKNITQARFYDHSLNSFAPKTTLFTPNSFTFTPRIGSYYSPYSSLNYFSINPYLRTYIDQWRVKDAVENAVKNELLFGSPSFFSAYSRACSSLGIGYTLSLSEFRSIASSCNLMTSYNSYHSEGRLRDVENFCRDIGGVGSEVAIIEDMIDSETQAASLEYFLCFPSEQFPFSKELVQCIAQEQADIFFTYKTLPFFSLHFNEQGFLYPVLHPAYQNTLTGLTISFLDYWMKCYLNGGFFDEAFLKMWDINKICDETYLRSQLIDLKKYYKTHCKDQPYFSLRELSSRYGLKEEGSLTSSYSQPFMTSFRIIAAQEKIERDGNVLIPYPTFRIEYSIDMMPDYQHAVEQYKKKHGQYPPEYQKIRLCYEQFAQEIKEKLPQAPFCRDYFKLLGVMNSFCYFYTTLDKMGKRPDLKPFSQERNDLTPTAFPPIPVRYHQTYPIEITLEAVIRECLSSSTSQEIDQTLLSLFSQKRIRHLPISLVQKIQQAVLKILQNQMKNYLKEGDQLEINDDEMERVTRFVEGYVLQVMKQTAVELQALTKKIIEILPEDQQKTFSILSLPQKFPLIQEALKTQLEKIKERWNGSPELAQTECFDELPKEIHNGMREIFKEVEERTQKELKEFIAKIEIDLKGQTQSLVDGIKKQIVDLGQKAQIEDCKLNAILNLDQFYISYIKRLGDFLNTMSHFTQVILDVPEIAKFKVSKQYTHTFIGFTGNALSQKIGDHFRIIGGCGMSLPNLTSTPIEQAENFILAFSQVFENKTDSISAFEFNKQSYQVFRLPVIDVEHQLEESFLQENNALTFLEKIIETGEVPDVMDPEWLKTSVDQSGALLMHYAASTFNEVQLQKLIMLSKEQINVPDLLGFLPIHVAARNGNVSAVIQFINCSNTQKEVKAKNGLTPLMLAVQYGQKAVVETLLKFALDANTQLPNGLFPLYVSIQNNFPDIALLLLDSPGSNPSINQKIDSHMTSLHLAIENGLTTVALRLIEKGAFLDVKRKLDGYTPFHCAVKRGQLEIAKAMIARGVSVHLPLESKKQPLHIAAECGHLEMVDYLLSVGACVDEMTSDGQTPLMLALMAGHPRVAERLALQSTINGKNNQGQTASIISLQCGIPTVGDILIFRGEDPKLSDHSGYNYLYYLVRNGEYKRLTNLIKQKKPDLTQTFDGDSLVTIAAKWGHFLLVYDLLDQNVPFKNRSSKAQLIHYAVMADEIGFLREWLETHGVDEGNVVLGNNESQSLAFIAAQQGSKQCLKWLLKKMTPFEMEKQSLLAASLESRDPEIVNLVLQRWENINQPLDPYYNTALHLAVKMGSRTLVELLLSRGADINLRNNQQQTAFHIAFSQSDDYLLKRLFKLSEPSQWPIELWADPIKHQTIKPTQPITKVLNKYQKRLPHSDSFLKKEENLPQVNTSVIEKFSAELEIELFFLIEEEAFDDVVELFENNPSLLNLFKSQRGEKLFLKIFEHIYDPSILIKLLENIGKKEVISDLSSSPERLLKFIQKMGINPSDFRGKNNPLLAMVNAETEIEACYRLEIFSTYFPESLVPLAKDPVIKNIPLVQLALRRNQLKLFEKLDDIIGQSTSMTNQGTFSAIHEAVLVDNYELVSTLLKRYSVNSLNHLGQTPLMLAAANNNVRMMALLLQWGANPDLVDINGRNVLHYALSEKAETAALFILPLLRKRNQPDRYGQTPLSTAAVKGLFSVVRYLCQEGDYTQDFNHQGYNALHLAAMAGQTKIVTYLVQCGFPVDQVESPKHSSKTKKCLKRTALHLAALFAHPETVSALIRLGTDPEQKDIRGNTVSEYAVLSKDSEMLSLIEQLPNYHNKDHNTRLLLIAAQSNHVEVISELILDDINLNGVDENGHTALHISAIFDSGEVMSLLLKGESMALDLPDYSGNTALHLGAHYGHVRAIELLINAGSDINKTNQNQQTPLFRACEQGHLGAVIALLKHKADYSIPNKEGITPLQIALLNGHTRIVDQLVAKGDRSFQKEALESLPTSIKDEIMKTHSTFLEKLEKYAPEMRISNSLSRFGIYRPHSESSTTHLQNFSNSI